MFCPYCGKPITHSEDKCLHCNMPVFYTCNKCGSICLYNNKHKFCADCGTEIHAKLVTKKLTRQDETNQKYGLVLAKVRDLLYLQTSYISYQYIAEYIGLSSCYDKLNQQDDKSTVGYLIYLDKLRDLGFTVKIFNVKYDKPLGYVGQTSFIMRYIGPRNANFQVEHQEIIQEIHKAYKDIDFTHLTLTDISEKN